MIEPLDVLDEIFDIGNAIFGTLIVTTNYTPDITNRLSPIKNIQCPVCSNTDTCCVELDYSVVVSRGGIVTHPNTPSYEFYCTLCQIVWKTIRLGYST